MEIPEKLIKFKIHILLALLLCVAVSVLILVAPRFLTILAYFWPLLVSTALFLASVLVFGKTTAASPAVADKAGEGLLDFVAGQPDHHHGHHHHHHPVEGFKVEEEDSVSHGEHRVESSNSKSE
ncbi:hypothetical protein L484_018231 [Morus notabilis]|uniref:Transmembrane protein n=1 Tax=Morus notabilis TaxID=981085 RepID=W9R1E7_9ROSA|nr:uncharacterized protein LOC21401206 [Morus notabilis]EXB36073.1 hypothetical protein L484_018231 [Morus notabilis]